jgi:hypothetical protein
MNTDNRGQFQHLQNYAANYTPRPHQREFIQRLASEDPSWEHQLYGGRTGLRRGITYFQSARTGVPRTIEQLHRRLLMREFHEAQRSMCNSFGVPTKLLYQSSYSGYSRFDDEYYALLTGIENPYLPAPMLSYPKLTPLMFLRLLGGPKTPYRHSGKSLSVRMITPYLKPLCSMYRYPAAVGLRMEMVRPLEPRGMRHYYAMFDYMDSITPMARMHEFKPSSPEVKVLLQKIRGANGLRLPPQVELKPDIEADYKRWAKRT